MRPSVVAIVGATVIAAGCGHGDDDKRATPPAAARAAVTEFVGALQRKDYAAACGRLTAGAIRGVHASAFEGFRVSPNSDRSPEDQVKAAHERARSCAGALSLYVTGVDLAKVRAAAQTAPLHWIGDAAVLGEQDWGVRKVDGQWRVDLYNALADAGH